MTREEAIGTIRRCCPKISDSECDFETAMRFLIPELAESEDERIRKELIKYHKQQFENNRDQEVGLFHKDALAYLEKQKEQKPSEDELAKKHLDGYCMGREDTLREMKDFIESHFNTNKAEG